MRHANAGRQAQFSGTQPLALAQDHVTTGYVFTRTADVLAGRVKT
jgi:hypothetical protein